MNPKDAFRELKKFEDDVKETVIRYMGPEDRKTFTRKLIDNLASCDHSEGSIGDEDRWCASCGAVFRHGHWITPVTSDIAKLILAQSPLE
jgi:hypothetical protein